MFTGYVNHTYRGTHKEYDFKDDCIELIKDDCIEFKDDCIKLIKNDCIEFI